MYTFSARVCIGFVAQGDNPRFIVPFRDFGVGCEVLAPLAMIHRILPLIGRIFMAVAIAFLVGAEPRLASASTFQFGKDSPQVSEQFTASFLSPKIINIEQYLPPNSSGAFGSFVISTDSSSVNTNAFCTLFNVTDSVVSSYDVSPVANSAGQVKCTFSGSYNPAKQYSFIFTGYSNLVFGSTATTSVLIQGFSGTLVSQVLPAFCYSQHASGSHDNCDNMKTLNLTFDSSGSSTPFFGTNGVSRAGVLATCNITDISGCFVNALSWAFVPSYDVVEQFKSLSLASSSPFSYMYDFSKLSDELFVHPTTTIQIKIPFHIGHNSSTSTLTIFDSSKVVDYFPQAHLVRSLISAVLYFETAYINFKLALHFI